jgi:hypothetical protein
MIPKRAQVFDFGTISDVESHFSFAQDPLYKDARYYMVAIYRIFSDHYLPYTLCRRNIKAPAHLTFQIWQFLSRCGLINSQIDDRTKPNSMVPSFDKWPQLIYGINDHLYTLDQFNRRLLPAAGPLSLPISNYSMMSCPYTAPDRVPGTAEVPGLMSFGNWTPSDMDRLEKAFAPPECPMSWQDVAEKVPSKSTVECADQVAMLPVTISTVEHPAHQLKEPDGSPHDEMPSGPEIMKEFALAAAPNLRLVHRAVHAAGNEATYGLLRGEHPGLPQDAMQAAGMLAMERIGKNAAVLKAMHKRRVLGCMQAMVDIMRETIAMKNAAICDANMDQDIANPSESELSSDDKGWPSGTEDIP